MMPTTYRPLIVALGGLKRSGKDTFAGILAAAASTHRLTPPELRELYGSQGVIEFGIVTYWL